MVGLNIEKIKGISIVALVTILLAGCGGESTFQTSSDYGSEGSSDNIIGMSLGGVQRLNFSGNKADITFQNISENDLFLLIMNSNNFTGGNFNVQISDDLIALPSASSVMQATVEAPQSVEEKFNNLMRYTETILSTNKDYNVVTTSSMMGLKNAFRIGDTRSFKVLSSLNSITSYQTVDARLSYVGTDVLVYVDNNASTSITGMTDGDVGELAYALEDISMPVERNIFGGESDINGDNYITILMTPVLNGFSSSGMVTGFFFPGDLYEESSYNPASNEQEILYTMVPDPDGEFGPNTTKEFVLENILPGVLGHELQHMISYNQHVLVRGGAVEASWLNEGLSHFTEDIIGFGDENPSRLQLFLNKVESAPIPSSSSPTLAERGGLYAFIRYLYEQHPDGDEFLSKLYSTALTGIDNIEQAFDGTDPEFDEMEDFLARWHVALALSDTGITNDSRYQYQARHIDPDTGNYIGICIRCDADDGRGTVLSGPVMIEAETFPVVTSLSSGTVRFIQLNNVPSSITIQGSTGSSLGGSIVRLVE